VDHHREQRHLVQQHLEQRLAFRLELPVVELLFLACLYTRQRRVRQWK
jgi:hypothetical protein